MFETLTKKVTRTIHLIAWLQRNSVYLKSAVTIAEYLAKTAVLSNLPPDTAEKYKQILSTMGVHVEAANNQALAKCAMGMALPTLQGLFSHHQDPEDPIAVLIDTMGVAQDVMSRIHAVSKAPPSPSHKDMAQFISKNANPTQEAFEAAAKQAYGDTAHWLALALPGMKTTAAADAAAIEESLHAAYTKCVQWATAKVHETRDQPKIHHIVAACIDTKATGLHVSSIVEQVQHLGKVGVDPIK